VSIFVALLFSVSIVILMYLIVVPMFESATKAKTLFVDKTKVSLTDMYLFIDADKLFLISVALIFLASLILYVLTQSFIFTAMVAALLSFTPTLTLKILKNPNCLTFC